MSTRKYGRRSADGITVAFIVVWAIGALLTLAFWALVAWAIIKVVGAVTS